MQNIKLNVLVVEDDGYRINTFIEFLGSHNLVITNNSTEAIEHLHNDIYDIVCLDDKLGEDNGTGLEVAKYIATLGYEPEVIFHSINFLTFEKIKEILPWSLNKQFNTEEFYRLESTLYEQTI